MFDANTMLASLGAAIVTLASLTLVLSRVIPDEYDRRVPARQHRRRDIAPQPLARR